jgi:hypothetical protein
MSVRNFLLSAIVVLMAMFAVSCSGGGTIPVNDGGNPANQDNTTRITGYVSLDGNPEQSAEVAVYDLTDGSLKGNFTTGPDGKYKLDPVGGQYIIICASENGYSEPLYFNLANDGSQHQLNIQMKRYEGEDRGLIFCRITNEDDNTPIPNARIRLDEKEARSDAWGFCFFAGIPVRSEYKFNVQANGFSPGVHQVRVGQFDRTLILRAEFFKLSPATDDLASLYGVVRDIASGNDLGGVFVTLDKPNDPDFMSLSFMTNLGGVYRYYNLQKGTYSINAERTGYNSETHQVIINEEEGFFNIFMTPDALQMSTLQGTIYDQTGTLPLPNVNVTISNPLFGIKKDTITDGFGKFTFTGLVHGDYFVSAIHPIALFLPQGAPVTLIDETQQIQINLPFNESGALMGNVIVTGFTGFPTGAKVVAEKIGMPLSGLKFENNVDSYGKYAINGMLAGVYKVTVTVEYAADKMAQSIEYNVPINAGAATVLDFEITPVQ